MSFPKEYYNIYSLVINEKSKLHIKLTTINLENILKKKFPRWSYATFLNFDNFKLKIKDKTITARIHMLSVGKRFLKYKGRENTELFRLYKNEINELYGHHNIKREEQLKTNKELVNWMDYDEMKKLIMEHIPKYLMKPDFNYYRLRDLLIMSFYILQTPVRLTNLSELKYINSPQIELRHLPKEYNYIMKEGNSYKLVYNVFKTYKHIGQVELYIKNQLLINLLDKYISIFLKNKEEGFLFTKLDLNSKLSTVSLEQAIKKEGLNIFKKENITLNLIRHSFFTSFFKSNPSIKEQRKIAFEAGQTFSPSMSLQYARID